jgi:hypothetical protein
MFLRYIFIIAIHLCLGLPSGLMPSGCPTRTLHALLPSPTHTACPAHVLLLDLITQIRSGEEFSSARVKQSKNMEI